MVPTILVVALIGVATAHALTLPSVPIPLLVGGLFAVLLLLLVMVAGYVSSRGRRPKALTPDEVDR